MKAADEEVDDGWDYEEPDPKLEYYDSILVRHEELREQLQQTPPAEAVEALDAEHPTSLGQLETKVVRWWKWKIRTSDPIPVQIACMDKGTVLKLLKLITMGAFLKRGAVVEIGVSAWVWSLLSRLPERGELTSEEIGVVRELGKKAVLVGMGLKQQIEWEEGMNEFEAEYQDADEDGDGHVESNKAVDDGSLIGPQMPTAEPTFEEPNLQPDVEDGEIPDDTAIEDDIATAKARLLSRLESKADLSSTPEISIENQASLEPKEAITTTAAESKAESVSRWNTKATVDMIITIAGEMYGQRDLLEFRSVWADA